MRWELSESRISGYNFHNHTHSHESGVFKIGPMLNDLQPAPGTWKHGNAVASGSSLSCRFLRPARVPCRISWRGVSISRGLADAAATTSSHRVIPSSTFLAKFYSSSLGESISEPSIEMLLGASSWHNIGRRSNVHARLSYEIHWCGKAPGSGNHPKLHCW